MSCTIVNLNDLTSMMKQNFNDLRSGAGVCFIVKRSENKKSFIQVMKLEEGWYASWDRFRDSFVLRYATTDPAFGDLITQSSFVAYGIADSDGQIDVYQISPDERDTVPPNESSPNWKVFVSRLSNERFTVPV